MHNDYFFETIEDLCYRLIILVKTCKDYWLEIFTAIIDSNIVWVNSTLYRFHYLAFCY